MADSLCQVRGRVTGGDCYRDELVTRVTVMRPASLPASITASHVITAEASTDHGLYLHSGPARVWPGSQCNSSRVQSCRWITIGSVSRCHITVRYFISTSASH